MPQTNVFRLLSPLQTGLILACAAGIFAAGLAGGHLITGGEAPWTWVAVGLLVIGLMLVAIARLYRDRQMAKARLDTALQTGLDAVITTDAAGRIVDFNPAAGVILGLERADMAKGLCLADLIADDPASRTLMQAMAGGQARIRVTARHRLGHEFPAEASVSAPLGLHRWVILRDLSVQVAAEQALMRARDEALAGEKAKADLLVVMSHEIRTPLNGMIGTIDLLDGTDLQPHQREYLRIMETSGKLLLHQVNDILDIARLDSGKAPISLGPVDLTQLIAEVFDNQSPASLTQGNRLVQVAPRDDRTSVIGDAAQLRQVLLNLVGNAVKFTERGTISVALTHLSPQGPTEICVSDTGIGIARGDLGRIFEDFVTLQPTQGRMSGTGLGLGIVKRIVARMGGTLSVESEPGVGSTFRVSLPLRILKTTAKPAPQQTLQRENGGRTPSWLALVVEDNAVNRLVMRDMLTTEGHQVMQARDGDEGVSLASARKFDIILMDISMPGTDGLQAAQAIRAGGASRDTPIVAVTAHAMPAEADRFRAGGMQHILVKPITRETLRAALAFELDGRATPLSDPPTPADPPLLDRAVLRNLAADIGSDPARRLVERFLTETESSIALLVESAAEAGPDDPAQRAVHRLQGASGMFGALALHQALARIETLFKTGALDEARAALPALQPLWQATAAAYREFDAFPQASSLR